MLRFRQQTALGVLMLPDFQPAADRQECIAAFRMLVFKTAYRLWGKTGCAVNVGDDFLFAANQGLDGLPIAVFGMNVGLGLRFRAYQNLAGTDAAVIVYMGFLGGKITHQHIFFGIAAVTVGVAFVFREGAGECLLRSIAGFLMGM